MPVLISEVTRMTMGNYCIAGWDIHGARMVRLLRSSGANWKLGIDRSIFSVGHLVNCSPSGKHNTVLPHANEDFPIIVYPDLLEIFDEPTTYGILLNKTVTSIRQLFGCALIDDKYVPEGTNCPSLGGVRTRRRRASFVEDGFGKLRLQLQDADDVSYRLAVTCDTLRHLFSRSDEDAEPHFGVAEANEWLCVNPPNVEIILRIGLARGWSGKEDNWNPPRCYAQLNGIICPEDNYHIFAGPPLL